MDPSAGRLDTEEVFTPDVDGSQFVERPAVFSVAGAGDDVVWLSGRTLSGDRGREDRPGGAIKGSLVELVENPARRGLDKLDQR